MNNNEGYPEPQDCWLYYIVSLTAKKNGMMMKSINSSQVWFKVPHQTLI